MHSLRTRFHPTPLALAVALALLASPTSQAQPAGGNSAVTLSIAAQPLDAALNELSAATGTPIGFSPALVAGRTAPALSGTLTAAQALERLLEGSGLAAVPEGGGMVIQPRPASDSVARLSTVTISGKAPGSVTEGTGSYTTGSTSSSLRLNLTPQETPQSITVITRQRLDDQKLDTLTDVLEATPGIIVQQPFVGQDSPDVYARGSYVNNYQVDGVPTSLSVGSYLANTAAYDRMEIVRRDTGIMNGLAPPAATVNLIRKRPTTEFQASVGAEYGTWERRGVDVDISGAVNESETARVRLVADAERQGAWADHFDQKNLALYGVAELDLSSQTLLTVGLHHLSQNTRAPIQGRPLFFSNGERIPLSPGDDGSPPWAHFDQDITGVFTSLEHRFGAGWVGKVEYSHTRYTNKAINSGVEGSIDAATGNGASIWPHRWAVKTRQDSLDSYVSGLFTLFGQEHELIAGVALSRLRDTATRYDDDWQNYPTDFNIFNLANTAPAPTFFLRDESTSRERQYSAYLNARFQLNDATNLLLGGRTTSWKREDSTLERKENVFVPYAGLVYALNDIWSVYGSYTKIFQPQDGRVFRYGSSGGNTDPERGEGYELGVKALFLGGRLSFNLALYQSDVSNLAVWNPSTRVYDIHGETRTRGVDLELHGELAIGWQLGAGYSYAKTKDGDGDRTLTRLPQHTFKLFTTYRLPGAWNPLTIGGGVNWQSSIESSRSGANPYRQSSLALFSLMARYEVNRHLTLAVNVNNAFNKQYYSTVANDYGTFGAPRSVIASLKYTF